MGIYRSPDGKGWMHVNMGRRAGPAPCAAPRLETDNADLGPRCCRASGKLCDAPVGQDLGGARLTCDMPLCEHHATPGGKGLDYCPRHKHLAQPGLPL